MKNLFLLSIIFVFKSTAMYMYPAIQLDYISHTITGTVTHIKYIQRHAAHPRSHFEARVSFDSTTGTYKGTYYNNNISHEEWTELPLTPEEAESYYKWLKPCLKQSKADT